MWIRSQDKKTLMNINTARVWNETSIYAKAVDSLIGIGKYETKEQALEVLQQIEDRINEGCAYVYQMPSANYVQALLDEYEPEWTPVQNINKYENMVDGTMIPEIIDEAANAIAQSIDEKILKELNK